MKHVAITLGLVLLVGGGSPGVLAAERGGFFSCPEIVFFGPCSKTAPAPAEPYIKDAPDKVESAPKAVSPPPSAKPPEVEESMWAEPVRGPDGRFRVYLPPKPVRDFIEKPTSENARAYLEWNQARMRQMDEAVSVMRDVAAHQLGITTQGAITPPPLPLPAPNSIQVQASAPGAAATRPISIVYAFATWCPYSRRQTPIINQLAIHVPVRGIAFDSQPDEVQALRPALAFPVVQGDVDLRQRLGVRSYPTIFFYEGSRLHHVARGLQSPDRLVAVLAALGGGQRLSTLESRDQRLADTCQLRT